MKAEIFQIVKLFNRDMYQVSIRELLGVHAMTHRITSYLTQDLPEGWEETPDGTVQPTANSSTPKLITSSLSSQAAQLHRCV